MADQTINDHPLKVVTAASDYDGETINDHPMLVTIVGGGGGGGGDSYDFANGLTEASGTVKLGGSVTERIDLAIASGVDGFYITHADGANLGIAAGQTTFGVTGSDAGYISMYPSTVGIAAESGGGAVQNLILLQPESLTISSLPSSRDDSSSTTPENFLYTSADGVVLSSPVSAISSAKGKVYEVYAMEESYDIPSDAQTVVYLDGQPAGVALPEATEGRTIDILYMYSEPATMTGSFIPEITLAPYTAYKVFAYSPQEGVFAWLAVETGAVPLS